AQQGGTAAEVGGGERGGTRERGQRLARERQQRRTVGALERQSPCRGGLEPVRGADHEQVGDQPQRREVLDRLVRGPVLAEEDAVVRVDVDDVQLHQRREADRRARVVGEGEERGAERQPATGQREA